MQIAITNRAHVAVIRLLLDAGQKPFIIPTDVCTEKTTKLTRYNHYPVSHFDSDGDLVTEEGDCFTLKNLLNLGVRFDTPAGLAEERVAEMVELQKIEQRQNLMERFALYTEQRTLAVGDVVRVIAELAAGTLKEEVRESEAVIVRFLDTPFEGYKAAEDVSDLCSNVAARILDVEIALNLPCGKFVTYLADTRVLQKVD